MDEFAISREAETACSLLFNSVLAMFCLLCFVSTIQFKKQAGSLL
ncbi:hypothetical protein N482_22305 [Pseudoalteromonas luteoviolacea NCIMB 1942]|uniref:Uncharacterized protein n=1 Tax=Pseudoalteromonas luteoviolacea NCIMB 1942 TaxID=1365253 RepID=A0A167HQ75_9GAMM|nr:hypothetical protein N482_22305 [Pseudoalteromonas luteoviolacea NCIMB 1942]